MTYSVTAIRAAPDIGFQSGHRHTAEAAMALATSYLASGLREIEVRDGRGNLRSLSDLERTTATDGVEEAGIARRLAALSATADLRRA